VNLEVIFSGAKLTQLKEKKGKKIKDGLDSSVAIYVIQAIGFEFSGYFCYFYSNPTFIFATKILDFGLF
jgi:hypothetical protein